MAPKINIQVIDITSNLGNFDAIANAANSTLQGGGNIDGAIYVAAGTDELRKEMAARYPDLVSKEQADPGKGKTGKAYISSGQKMQKHGVKAIIHAIGPRLSEKGKQPTSTEKKKLESAYQEIFARVKEYNYTHKANSIEHIAIPIISCNAYNYPQKEAVEVALAQAQKFCDDNPSSDLRITFVNNKTTGVWGELSQQFLALQSTHKGTELQSQDTPATLFDPALKVLSQHVSWTGQPFGALAELVDYRLLMTDTQARAASEKLSSRLDELTPAVLQEQAFFQAVRQGDLLTLKALIKRYPLEYSEVKNDLYRDSIQSRQPHPHITAFLLDYGNLEAQVIAYIKAADVAKSQDMIDLFLRQDDCPAGLLSGLLYEVMKVQNLKNTLAILAHPQCKSVEGLVIREPTFGLKQEIVDALLVFNTNNEHVKLILQTIADKIYGNNTQYATSKAGFVNHYIAYITQLSSTNNASNSQSNTPSINQQLANALNGNQDNEVLRLIEDTQFDAKAFLGTQNGKAAVKCYIDNLHTSTSTTTNDERLLTIIKIINTLTFKAGDSYDLARQRMENWFSETTKMSPALQEQAFQTLDKIYKTKPASSSLPSQQSIQTQVSTLTQEDCIERYPARNMGSLYISDDGVVSSAKDAELTACDVAHAKFLDDAYNKMLKPPQHDHIEEAFAVTALKNANDRWNKNDDESWKLKPKRYFGIGLEIGDPFPTILGGHDVNQVALNKKIKTLIAKDANNNLIVCDNIQDTQTLCAFRAKLLPGMTVAITLEGVAKIYNRNVQRFCADEKDNLSIDTPFADHTYNHIKKTNRALLDQGKGR